MLDREIGLPGKIPEHSAPQPAASKARVEGERTLDQSYGDIDVLAKIPEHERGTGKDIGVIRRGPERPAGQVDTLATAGLPVVRPAICVEQVVTVGRQGEGGAVMRIAFDRLPEQV